MFSRVEGIPMADVDRRVKPERAKGPPVLSTLLLDAAFSPTVSVGSSPPRIDLGYLGREAAWLQRRSGSREHAKIVWVSPERQVFLSSEIVGDKNSSTVMYYYHYHQQGVPRKDRKEYHVAAFIHGHPVPVPPSPSDVGPLLFEENVINSMPGIVVTTPIEKIAIFRSPLTPTYGEYEVESKVNYWIEEITDLYRKKNATGSYDALGVQIQNDVLKNKLREYCLNVYICPLRENTVQRQQL